MWAIYRLHFLLTLICTNLRFLLATLTYMQYWAICTSRLACSACLLPVTIAHHTLSLSVRNCPSPFDVHCVSNELPSADPESDKEATEMLTDNAQNLMKAVSEVLYSTEAASIRVPPDSEAGRLGLRWIKRQR